MNNNDISFDSNCIVHNPLYRNSPMRKIPDPNFQGRTATEIEDAPFSAKSLLIMGSAAVAGVLLGYVAHDPFRPKHMPALQKPTTVIPKNLQPLTLEPRHMAATQKPTSISQKNPQILTLLPKPMPAPQKPNVEFRPINEANFTNEVCPFGNETFSNSTIDPIIQKALNQTINNTKPIFDSFNETIKSRNNEKIESNVTKGVCPLENKTFSNSTILPLTSLSQDVNSDQEIKKTVSIIEEIKKLETERKSLIKGFIDYKSFNNRDFLDLLTSYADILHSHKLPDGANIHQVWADQHKMALEFLAFHKTLTMAPEQKLQALFSELCSEFENLADIKLDPSFKEKTLNKMVRSNLDAFQDVFAETVLDMPVGHMIEALKFFLGEEFRKNPFDVSHISNMGHSYAYHSSMSYIRNADSLDENFNKKFEAMREKLSLEMIEIFSKEGFNIMKRGSGIEGLRMIFEQQLVTGKYKAISKEQLEYLFGKGRNLSGKEARQMYNSIPKLIEEYGMKALQNKHNFTEDEIAYIACENRHNLRVYQRERGSECMQKVAELTDWIRSKNITGPSCEDIVKKYSGNATRIIKQAASPNEGVNFIAKVLPEQHLCALPDFARDGLVSTGVKIGHAYKLFSEGKTAGAIDVIKPNAEQGKLAAAGLIAYKVVQFTTQFGRWAIGL